MTIKQQFDAAIREHLPGMVGDELRKVLEDYEATKEKLNKAEGYVRDVEARNEKYRSAMLAHSNLDSRERQANEKDKQLEQRERNLQVEMLKVELDIQRKVTDHYATFMHMLARNTLFRRTFFGDVPVGVSHPDQYGNGNQAVTAGVTQETTEGKE